MAQWVGAQGQVKVARNTPTCGVPSENPPPKTKNFFSISTTRLAESAERLNSSLAESPGELQDCKALHETWFSRNLKGFNACKLSRSRLTPGVFRRSHTSACMLVTPIANMSTGVTAKHPVMVRAWTPGQQPTTSGCRMTQREQSVSPLTDGTSAPTRTWPCRCWSGQPTAGQTCFRKVLAVTTPTLPHNANEAQTSCTQRSGKA